MNRLELAKQLDYIREAGPNAGQRVEAIQKWGGGEKGQSWCCYWATLVLDVEFKGKSPVPRTGDCDVVLALGATSGWQVTDPQPGDLVLSIMPDDPTNAHHIGIITQSEPLTAIAGNTSRDGTSSNGDGVYEHAISSAHKVFLRVPQ